MPVWKRKYVVDEATTLENDIRVMLKTNNENDTMQLCSIEVHFTGMLEMMAEVTIVIWTHDEIHPGNWPHLIPLGDDGWQEVPQACGGGDPT
jgi:hypothetical protein